MVEEEPLEQEGEEQGGSSRSAAGEAAKELATKGAKKLAKKAVASLGWQFIGGCLGSTFVGIIVIAIFLVIGLVVYGYFTGELEESEAGECKGATSAVIDQATMDKINQNKSTYEAAAKKAGIPWEMIAAVHYREGSCNPKKSPVNGEELGTPNSDYGTLKEAAEASANLLKNRAKSVYNKNLNESPDDDTVGYAFLAYKRGYMYRDGLDKNGKPCPNQAQVKNTPYDKSPYVMNGFDDQHQNMKWNGCIDGGMTHVDKKLGALTIYKALKGGGEQCAYTTTTGEAEWEIKNGWEDWIKHPKVEQRPYTGDTAKRIHDKSRRKTNIQIVVCHYTGSTKDTLDSIWNFFNNENSNSNAFTAFLVDRDGKIVQAAPANVREVGIRGYNEIAISIEGIGNFEAKPPTAAQMDSYVWLVKELLAKYNLKPCDVWGHMELNSNKSDPGDDFMIEMWKRLGVQGASISNHRGDHNGCNSYSRLPP